MSVTNICVLLDWRDASWFEPAITAFALLAVVAGVWWLPARKRGLVTTGIIFGSFLVAARLLHMVVDASWKREKAECRQQFLTIQPGVLQLDVDRNMPAHYRREQSGDLVRFSFKPRMICKHLSNDPGFLVHVSKDGKVIRTEWDVPD